jgi:hypothetical protein
MRPRTLALAVAAVALCGALAPDALAHSTSPPSPRAGDGGTRFVFKGRAWQPRGVVRADYFRDPRREARPFSRSTFRANGAGRFTFRLGNPWFFDSGRTQVMCFVQRDTRFGRTFRSCERFYVAPASAYFMPADGNPGDVFWLVANGFEPGRTLRIELTTPTGAVQPYSMTTRTRGTFVAGGPFGPLYVPRGGAFRRFQSNTTDPLGFYAAFVTDPGTPARARALVRLLPP